MNNRQQALALLSLLALVGCRHHGTRPSAAETPPPEAASTQSAAMLALVDMKEGRWSRLELPEVAWSDVPVLLQIADSTEPLARIPTNPLSSQMQSRCSEGVMALWLVESARADAPLGYPSLNPLLLGGDHEDLRDWNAISERNHEPAVEAYRAWWNRVRKLSEEERASDDPLAGTSINWH